MSVPPPSVMWTATQPPFTAAQWQELEHQALIFKYLKAGLSVPPDLLVPIRKSLQLMSHPSRNNLNLNLNLNNLNYPFSLLFSYPLKFFPFLIFLLFFAVGYYGKKIDPEPGRCRRTDGKKWRCSRDAHPDSKYCDRHMIRRRYRSRKPVESQPQPSTSSSSSQTGSTVTASATATSTFHTLPLHTNGTREGFSFSLGNNNTTLPQIDPLLLPLQGSKKPYRFGLNSEADEHSILQKDLGSVKYQGYYDFTSDGMWSNMSQIPSNTVSESRSGSTMVGNCFQQRSMRDAELFSLDTTRSKELAFSGQLCSAGCLKQEYQSPQSLFSDWHWKKDSGSSAIEYRPNKDFNCNPDVNADSNGSL